MQKNMSGGKAVKSSAGRGSGSTRKIGNKIPSNSSQARGVIGMAKASARRKSR